MCLYSPLKYNIFYFQCYDENPNKTISAQQVCYVLVGFSPIDPVLNNDNLCSQVMLCFQVQENQRTGNVISVRKRTSAVRVWLAISG